MRQLIIRPGAIGDCIVSLSAIRCLADDATEIWVNGLCRDFYGFAGSCRDITSTGLFLLGLTSNSITQSLTSRLRSFDRIISWYTAAGTPEREAIRDAGVECTFFESLPPGSWPKSAEDFFLEQVFQRFAISGNRLRDLELSDKRQRSAGRLVVSIQPFASRAEKEWPLANFVELSRRLRCLADVEWIVSPENIFRMVSVDNAVYCLPSLKEVRQRISHGDVFIGNDSGITHIASLTGVPTVAIFGSTNPTIWAPTGSGEVFVVQHPSGSIGNIDVSEVEELVESVLLRNHV